MKKLYKLVASLLAVIMLMSSVNIVALAAEIEDQLNDYSDTAVVVSAAADDGSSTAGILDGINIDWDSYVAESTGTKLTRDYTLGISEEIYRAVPTGGGEERFEHVRSELPEELPVFAPYTKAEIAASKVKFYVAPYGKDTNPGTIDEPFATPARAVKAVNKLKSKLGGVTVYFREGTYSFTKTLELSAKSGGSDEDNLVFYSNYEDEKVTFTCAAAIAGSQLKKADDATFKRKVSEQAQPHIYSVNLKELGYTDFATFTRDERPTLYVDGAEYTIARWPNSGYTSMARYTGPGAMHGVVNSGYIKIESKIGKAGTGISGIEWKVANSRPFSWENTGNIWVYGYFFEDFLRLHYQIKSMDPKAFTVKSYDNDDYGAQFVKEPNFYYYNVLEELDNPSEWFIDDKTGMLYIYPSSEITDDTVVQLLTSRITLVELENTDYAVFNGITFDVGDIGVNMSYGTDHNLIQRCTLQNMATYDVYFSDAKHSGIVCSVAKDNGGILLGGATESYIRYNSSRNGNFAQNNYAKFIRVGAYGRGDIASHNVVTGARGASIYVSGGTEQIVEYNEVVAAPDETLDQGMIYINGSSTNYGNIVRHNYFGRQTPTIRSAPYSIYVDDMASGQYVYGNVLREGKIYLHGGRWNVINNNMVVDLGTVNAMSNSDNYSLSAVRWNGWVLTGTRYTKSPVFYGLYWSVRYPYNADWHAGIIQHRYDFQNNPNYNPQTDVFGESLAAPQGNVYNNNVFVNSTFNINAPKREVDEICENNYIYEDASVLEFADYENGIYDVDEEKFAQLCPGVEPFKKYVQMGVIFDPALIAEPMKIQAIKPQSPVDTTETAILPSGITLKWNEAFGKSVYNVTVATDPELKNVVYEKETQAESVILPDLEYGQTYYWNVVATSWSQKFDTTPVVMKTATFKTYTFDEAVNYIEVDSSVIDNYIGEIESLMASGDIIEEGTEAAEGIAQDMPVYKSGVTDAVNAFLAEAKEKKETLKLQKDIDEYSSTMMQRFYVLVESYAKEYTVNMGQGSHKFDASQFKTNTDVKTAYNGDSLVMDDVALTGVAAGQKKAINSGATLAFSVKHDKLDSWTGIALRTSQVTQGSLTSIIGYGLVIKSDLIELQRYPKRTNETSAVICEVVNNEEIIRPGQWANITSKISNVSNGMKIVIKVNGETIIDMVDTNAPVDVLGAPGYYGFMHHMKNARTEYAGISDIQQAEDDFVSTVALEKAISSATSYAASIVESNAASETPTYKTGAKNKIMDAVSAAKAKLETVASKDDVTAATEELNAVVADVRQNYAHECVHTIRTLDLNQWTLSSGLAVATIAENGGIIAITPDETESTMYEYKKALTSKQSMRFNLKYDNLGNWQAICTRKVSKGTTPTQSRGYFFVIKDDLIEFQKYTAKGKGKILASIENNNQIIKAGVTYIVEIGSVNVEGGVLSTLKVNGETVLEYLDTEDPIYDEGYFSLFCNKSFGRVALGYIGQD